jgi:hypothetical protein
MQTKDKVKSWCCYENVLIQSRIHWKIWHALIMQIWHWLEMVEHNSEYANWRPVFLLHFFIGCTNSGTDKARVTVLRTGTIKWMSGAWWCRICRCVSYPVSSEGLGSNGSMKRA